MNIEMISVISVIVLPLLKERGFCLRIVVVQHWVLTLHEWFLVVVFSLGFLGEGWWWCVCFFEKPLLY